MEELREILCHYCFFPEIRAVGYDPSANIRNAVRSQVNAGGLETLGEAWWPLLHGRCILELDDRYLLAEVEDRMHGRGFDLEKGRALARLVQDSDPCDARSFVSLLVACANLVFGHQCRFSFHK